MIKLSKKRIVEWLIILGVLVPIDTAYLYVLFNFKVHVVIIFFVGLFILQINGAVLFVSLRSVMFNIKEKKRRKKLIENQEGR